MFLYLIGTDGDLLKASKGSSVQFNNRQCRSLAVDSVVVCKSLYKSHSVEKQSGGEVHPASAAAICHKGLISGKNYFIRENGRE